MINWIKLTKDTLPPPNIAVWVKREANKKEDVPIYIGYRTNMDFVSSGEASYNCHWYGQNVNEPIESFSSSLRLPYNFSDVTVLAWANIEKP